MWFVIFALITFSMAGTFAASFPGLPPAAHFLIGVTASLLFFGSALFHEMAHSLIAIRSGKLVSSITLFIFGDVSEIRKEADRPGEEIRIALPPDGAARIISVAETLPPEVLVLPPPSSFS